MPFTLLSHQGPVLPLKLAWPRRVCGTALVTGSMAPDLEYFVHANPTPVHGHTLAGQLYYSLPLGFALVLLIRYVIAEPLAAHLPDGSPLHLRDYRLLTRARLGAADALRIVVGILVGAYSHIALDAFTHDEGWGVEHLPGLRGVLFTLFGKPVPGYRLLQGGGSLLGAAMALAVIAYVGQRRLLPLWYAGLEARPGGERRATPRSRRVLRASIAACTIAGAMIRFGYVPSTRAYGEAWYWGHEILQLACYAFIGVALGCVLCRRGMARAGETTSD